VNQVTYLQPGDVVFQYTDGVTEAMTSEREQFGAERLIEAIKDLRSPDPEDLLGLVRQEVDGFADGAPQFDDITMLALRYRGQETRQTE